MKSTDRPGDVARTTRDVYRAMSASSVGIEMGLSVLIGLAFGWWLDGQTGTAPLFMILFLLFGVAAGFKGVFREIKKADRIAAEREAEEAAK